jgi:hypothetical protein
VTQQAVHAVIELIEKRGLIETDEKTGNKYRLSIGREEVSLGREEVSPEPTSATS